MKNKRFDKPKLTVYKVGKNKVLVQRSMYERVKGRLLTIDRVMSVFKWLEIDEVIL